MFFDEKSNKKMTYCMLYGEEKNEKIKKIIDEIKKYYHNLEIVKIFVTARNERLKSSVFSKEIKDFLTKDNNIILIPKDYYWNQTYIVSDLIKNNIPTKKIYLIDFIRTIHSCNFIHAFNDDPYLPYLEFHVADHCNLNCAACEHYSGLVKENIFPRTNKLFSDLVQLNKIIKEIGMIRILGGEPLLNPDINLIINQTRRLWPEARIAVVTNGLKLFSMSTDFFQTIRENDIRIHLSYYPIIKRSENELKKFFEKNQIKGTVSELYNYFEKKQVIIPHDHPTDTFFECLQARCHNLYDGKISTCFLPFTTKYFNREFNTKIPENEAINLYSRGLTVKKIKDFLLSPISRCRWCELPAEKIKWRIMKSPPILSDWIKNTD